MKRKIPGNVERRILFKTAIVARISQSRVFIFRRMFHVARTTVPKTIVFHKGTLISFETNEKKIENGFLELFVLGVFLQITRIQRQLLFFLSTDIQRHL